MLPGSNPSSDSRTHQTVTTGKMKPEHEGKASGTVNCHHYFYGWGNQGPERARDLPKVTQ